jgi:hypothetical protein
MPKREVPLARRCRRSEWDTQGSVMTTQQAMLFAVMLAWTPLVLVLACIVRDIRRTPGEELD